LNRLVLARGTRVICVLVVAVLLGLTAGCSSDEDAASSTTESAVTTTTASTTASDTTATTSSLITEWDRKLKEVAVVQNQLAGILLEENAPDDDPRMGIVHGLRACTQAIACREALDQQNLALADTAMQELRYSLNLARDVATGTVAQKVAGARAIIEPLGKPSAAPEEATRLLDAFLTALTPLVDDAKALLPETTTTT